MRIGNAASEQFQLDIYGELVDCLHHARSHGVETEPDVWKVQRELLRYLERVWTEPDEGIWEVRGPRRHFTHSKVMIWVAFDRMIKDAIRFGLEGPIDSWQAMRDRSMTTSAIAASIEGMERSPRHTVARSSTRAFSSSRSSASCHPRTRVSAGR